MSTTSTTSATRATGRGASPALVRAGDTGRGDTGHGDAVEGHLPRSLLRAALHVALLPGPSHGYDLLVMVRDFGLGSVDLAGLYRSLRAMEHDGLTVSAWEASELGPPRRVYELTAAGVEAAEQHLEALRIMRRHLDRIIGSASTP